MTELSRRLECIAGLVPKGAKIADIGTDHGYLPIYLSISGIIDGAIACDINEKPLESARRNIKKYSALNIVLRISDGLREINPDEADTVIIAGLGGEVISDILDRAKEFFRQDKLFILQPMNSPELLREFLCKSGFSIKSERAVFDCNRIYTVIEAVYTGEIHNDECFFYTGKLNPEISDDRFFLENQYKRLDTCRKDIKNIASKHNDFLFLDKICKHLEKILEDR